jgi:hypothetical protein
MAMQSKASVPGLPTVLVGTTTEPDEMSEDHMAVFKQELNLEVCSTLMLVMKRISIG